MIEFRQGNLLDADAEALVNTVNCVGVMGKGIALQFKKAYPENFREYERACKAEMVRLGQMFVVQSGLLANPRYIVNFPTKDHWKGRSRLGDIRAGLADLIRVVRQYGIKSIALPPLGCGNGGLDWSDVFPLIEAAFTELPTVHVLAYAPLMAGKAVKIPAARKRPRMTRSRALLILLIDRYREPGYRLTKLEAQKLAYFLQVAGEKLKLRFVKHTFGPYADNLNHTLLDMEGHFIKGFGDRSSDSSICPIPDAVNEARELLRNDPEATDRLEKVSRLIEGFENAYGMELLASLLWVASENMFASTDPNTATEQLHLWNDRKRATFRAEHAQKAWHRLRQLNWLGGQASES